PKVRGSHEATEPAWLPRRALASRRKRCQPAGRNAHPFGRTLSCVSRNAHPRIPPRGRLGRAVVRRPGALTQARRRGLAEHPRRTVEPAFSKNRIFLVRFNSRSLMCSAVNILRKESHILIPCGVWLG